MPIENEVREALREIRDEMQRHAKTTEQSESRIDILERLVEEHLTLCTRQQEELSQILEVVRNVNASMKVANLVRRIVIWAGGLTAALMSLYHAYKGQ